MSEQALNVGRGIGRTMAETALAELPADEREWIGIEAQDADQLTAAGLEDGTDEWATAEDEAEAEYLRVMAAAPHTFVYRDEAGSSEPLEAADMDGAMEEAEALCRNGDWGDDGAAITVYVARYDAMGEEVDNRRMMVEIEPNHERLIRKAIHYFDDQSHTCGVHPNDHDWTSEGEGGCDSNPGVWSTGGTSMAFASHCRTCGLQRREHTCGSRRNPGDHDTVSYEMPDEWCATCEREDCGCEKDEES